eukprot:NODE_6727_length_505_cov_16.513228_g6561_i0.p1 GENE.NODE_6727_length_505_cov_16.513228_g6561_i0~~NODE_6727_length_505_cov_16.513228_g6561_i0.p1  ORF type:complete len:151 (-),score=29.72 NODE_6727_length_505_cov_16.513228_g6561_i0:52-453(-)
MMLARSRPLVSAVYRFRHLPRPLHFAAPHFQTHAPALQRNTRAFSTNHTHGPEDAILKNGVYVCARCGTPLYLPSTADGELRFTGAIPEAISSEMVDSQTILSCAVCGTKVGVMVEGVHVITKDCVELEVADN